MQNLVLWWEVTKYSNYWVQAEFVESSGGGESSILKYKDPDVGSNPDGADHRFHESLEDSMLWPKENTLTKMQQHMVWWEVTNELNYCIQAEFVEHFRWRREWNSYYMKIMMLVITWCCIPQGGWKPWRVCVMAKREHIQLKCKNVCFDERQLINKIMRFRQNL